MSDTLSNMTSQLVISAIGEDQTGLVDRLSQWVLENDCNIEDSRMVVLGGEFAVLLLVSGNWNNIAKLENQAPGLQDKLGMQLTVKRTNKPSQKGAFLPYAVDVVALDHPGIVHSLASFFSYRHISIKDLSTSSYAAAHTGTPMFSIHMLIDVPADTHIATMREEFQNFCDQLNLDAGIEPASN